MQHHKFEVRLLEAIKSSKVRVIAEERKPELWAEIDSCEKTGLHCHRKSQQNKIKHSGLFNQLKETVHFAWAIVSLLVDSLHWGQMENIGLGTISPWVTGDKVLAGQPSWSYSQPYCQWLSKLAETALSASRCSLGDPRVRHGARLWVQGVQRKNTTPSLRELPWRKLRVTPKFCMRSV